jgi:transcriptional regulator with XRE-family HTH domain
VANRIAAIREEKGLGLSDVARLAKTTPAQIQKLERGERRLTVEWMRRLADAMGVKPSELLDAIDVESPGSRTGALASALEKFIGPERDVAEELAGEFLELLLRYRAALDLPRGRRRMRSGVFSSEQVDVVRTLIRLSRNLAEELGQQEMKRNTSRRAGR